MNVWRFGGYILHPAFATFGQHRLAIWQSECLPIWQPWTRVVAASVTHVSYNEGPYPLTAPLSFVIATMMSGVKTKKSACGKSKKMEAASTA